MNKPVFLLVEDDPYNRDILREILEDYADCEIVETTNGREALNWLLDQSKLPNLILLDMMMPEMDGFEFLRHLGNHPQHDQLRVAGVSARAHSHDRDRALQAGCWRYLTKPFDIHEIESTIAAALTN
ncbi:response regulator [Herpetosiphon giganteus]|uniref:response regulator n=1 Tax=Herpetosiphon giganteus TaxID=2029754 RepID=UPI00195B75BB|nr:response regulator [Herpetosiphon giganteus]MBM7843406.1 CheY-like chemotaxis protein [Herpetosiphon giganteus]